MRWRIWFSDNEVVDIVGGFEEEEIWSEYYDAIKIECLGYD